MAKETFYKETDNNPLFPEIEENVIKNWKEKDIFRKSVEQRSSNNGAGSQTSKEWIFYDGPPFANGLPHYGHLLTSCVKDLYARYQTMKGKKVERRFGWDCHGLPAEMEAEKELQVSGRAAIEAFGIDKFNDHCRSSVMKYTDVWQDYINRAGRWVDFENDYKTMDKSYMESVIWAFSELYKKDYIYESHRVMPYSWAAQTPLSNFETRMDDAYRDREDKAVTVAFELEEVPSLAIQQELGLQPNVSNKIYMLAWTTTPWTLPSNLALGISSDMEYVAVNPDTNNVDDYYILSRSALAEYGLPILKNVGNEEEPINIDNYIKNIKGSRLVDLSYKPLFPYFANTRNAFKILEADFIEEGSGTGVVHLAPGFGEDDQRVCADNDIGVICPVDEAGCYTDAIFDIEGDIPLKLKGLNVIAAKEKCDDEPYNEKQLEKNGLVNLRIINYLKMTGQLVKSEDYVHSYPHCWRTDTPLIYKAVPSWYVEVTKFKDRMVELNQNINWIPDHIKDGQFGKWLEGARDWSISRNRYWGCPIPVWRTPSGKIKVFGSIAEMEEFFLDDASQEQINKWLKDGVVKLKSSSPESHSDYRAIHGDVDSPIIVSDSGNDRLYTIPDLHRPFIDELTKEVDGETYTRVTDVFDCWFESGSMPYAQVHYPFENKKHFEENFPADFIVEYVGQTRGWFYTLMVLSTALFDREPFKNCICHGVILGEPTLDKATGKMRKQKLSKRLKNYPDPNEMFDIYGADAMRWRMISEPVMHGGELVISKDGSDFKDVVRLTIKPIWNAYHFFTLYANTDGIKARLCVDSDNLMDRYILGKLKHAIFTIEKAFDNFDTPVACKEVEYFFEVLNNWYIRRNRDRFWREANDSDNDKFAAYNTLYTCLNKICRAIAPLLPLTTEEIYKGLTGEESIHLANFPETDHMADEATLMKDMDHVRNSCNAALSVRDKENIRTRQPLQSLTIYSSAESNLEIEDFADLIRDEINVKDVFFSNELDNVASLKLQINFPVAGKRLGAKMKQIAGAAKQGNWEKNDNGDVVVAGEKMENGEYSLQLEAKGIKGAQALSTNDALVVLDLDISEELRKEGIARDVVRGIQQARRDADLHVSDRIKVFVSGNENIVDAINNNISYIKEQTLSSSLEFNSDKDHRHNTILEFGVDKISIGFDVAV